MSNEFYIGILNGGKSNRMGKPKALIQYKGKSFFEIIYEIAKNFSSNIYRLGDAEVPQQYRSVPIINDNKKLGPLSGIISAYNFKNIDWLILAVDMPLITKEMIEEILILREKNKKGVIPYNKEIDKFEPFCAYYSKELLYNIINTISKENYSLQRILKILNFEGNSELFEKYKKNFKSINKYEDL